MDVRMTSRSLTIRMPEVLTEVDLADVEDAVLLMLKQLRRRVRVGQAITTAFMCAMPAAPANKGTEQTNGTPKPDNGPSPVQIVMPKPPAGSMVARNLARMKAAVIERGSMTRKEMCEATGLNQTQVDQVMSRFGHFFIKESLERVDAKSCRFTYRWHDESEATTATAARESHELNGATEKQVQS